MVHFVHSGHLWIILDPKFEARQAEAAALQTSLGRPDLSTMAMRHCGNALRKLDVQLWHKQRSKPLPRISLTFLSWLEKVGLEKVDGLPKCLERFPLFSQKQKRHKKTMIESQTTQAKPAQPFGTEGWKRLSSQQFLSCCIEAFSTQLALVGLVIIRWHISFMSLSIFQCLSSVGPLRALECVVFRQACSSVRNAFVNAN